MASFPTLLSMQHAVPPQSLSWSMYSVVFIAGKQGNKREGRGGKAESEKKQNKTEITSIFFTGTEWILQPLALPP